MHVSSLIVSLQTYYLEHLDQLQSAVFSQSILCNIVIVSIVLLNNYFNCFKVNQKHGFDSPDQICHIDLVAFVWLSVCPGSRGRIVAVLSIGIRQRY